MEERIVMFWRLLFSGPQAPGVKRPPVFLLTLLGGSGDEHVVPRMEPTSASFPVPRSFLIFPLG